MESSERTAAGSGQNPPQRFDIRMRGFNAPVYLFSRDSAPGSEGHQSRSPRGVVVLLPAMGTAAGYYAPFAQALTAHGLEVLSAEIPGTGTSLPRPSRKADYGYPELARVWLPRIVSLARDRAAGAPVTLLGHSLGGHIATFGAAGGAVSVDAVITLASGHIHYRNWPGASSAGILLASVLFPALTYLFGHMPGQYIGFGGPQASALIRQWAGLIRTGRFGDYYDASRSAGDFQALAIGFEGDSYAPPDSVAGLARLLKGETRQLEVDWPGNPHASWVRHTDRAVQEIIGWMRGNGLLA